MHEAAIALSILDIVIEKCTEMGGHSIDVVMIRIGKAAGVLPEALSFAFDAVKADTIAGGARLVIEKVPLGGICAACRQGFTVEEATYVFTCPLCYSNLIEINSGREMEIMEMEIDS